MRGYNKPLFCLQFVRQLMQPDAASIDRSGRPVEPVTHGSCSSVSMSRLSDVQISSSSVQSGEARVANIRGNVYSIHKPQRSRKAYV